MEALETGSRGRELLKDGEILGGGATIFALRDGLFAPCGSDEELAVAGLPLRPGEVILPRLDVFATDKLELESFCVCMRESSETRDLPIADGAREFGVEFPESEAVLILRLLTGIREVTGGRLKLPVGAVPSGLFEPPIISLLDR